MIRTKVLGAQIFRKFTYLLENTYFPVQCLIMISEPKKQLNPIHINLCYVLLKYKYPLTGWEHCIVCHNLFSGNHFVAHQFLPQPIQSNVYSFVLDSSLSVSVFIYFLPTSISRDCTTTLDMLLTHHFICKSLLTPVICR